MSHPKTVGNSFDLEVDELQVNETSEFKKTSSFEDTLEMINNDNTLTLGVSDSLEASIPLILPANIGIGGYALLTDGFGNTQWGSTISYIAISVPPQFTINGSSSASTTTTGTFNIEILNPSGTGSLLLQNSPSIIDSLTLTSGNGEIYINVPSISFTSYNFNLPSTVGTTGQVLTSQGGGSNEMIWTTPTVGTLTEVNLVVPAFLQVSGSPITSSGTFTITTTQTPTGTGKLVFDNAPTIVKPIIQGSPYSILAPFEPEAKMTDYIDTNNVIFTQELKLGVPLYVPPLLDTYPAIKMFATSDYNPATGELLLPSVHIGRDLIGPPGLGMTMTTAIGLIESKLSASKLTFFYDRTINVLPGLSIDTLLFPSIRLFEGPSKIAIDIFSAKAGLGTGNINIYGTSIFNGLFLDSNSLKIVSPTETLLQPGVFIGASIPAGPPSYELLFGVGALAQKTKMDLSGLEFATAGVQTFKLTPLSMTSAAAFTVNTTTAFSVAAGGLVSITAGAAMTLTATGASTITASAITVSTTGAFIVSGGVTTLTFGATTISAGTVIVTTGNFAATTGTTTFTANAFSVFTTLGVISLNTGAGVCAINTGAGAITLTTITGVITLTAGLGAVTITALAGAVVITGAAGNVDIKSGTGAINMTAPLGGINHGSDGDRVARFHVYTSNGGLGFQTGNIEFYTHKTGSNTGPGNFTVDLSQAYKGDFILTTDDFNITANTITLTNLTPSTTLGLDATNNIVSIPNTGTGLNVLANLPSFSNFKLVGSTSGEITFSAPDTFTSFDFKLPSSMGTAGQVLTSQGVNELIWSSAAVGSVTSVDITVPTIFTISGGPITTSGTFVISLANTPTGTGSIVLATSPTISNLFSTSQASFLNGGIDTDLTTNQILFGFSGSEMYRHAIRTRHSSGTDLNNAIDFYCWDTSISSTTSPTRRVMSIDSTGVFVRTGSVNIDTLTASSALATDASKNLVSISNTGTGSNVLATSPTLTTPNIGVASATSLTASSSITGYNLQAFDNVLSGHDVDSLKFGVNNSDYNCALLNFTFVGDGSKTNFTSIKLKGSYSQLVIDDDSIVIVAETFVPPDIIPTSSRISVVSTGISFESGGSLNFNNVTTLSPSTTLGLDGSKNLVSLTTTTGTVTSVDITVPTIFTIAGGPITTSGTFAISLANTPTGTGSIVLATSPTLTTPNIGVASATSLTASSSITGYNLQAFDNVLSGHDVDSLKFGVNNSDYNCALLNFTFVGDGSKTNFTSIKLKGSYSQLVIDDDSIVIVAETFVPPDIIPTSSRISVVSTGISFESGGSLNFSNVTTLSPSTTLGLDGSKNLVSLTTTTGTVTSVDITVPTIFTISGGPITTSGTFAISLANTPTGTGSLVLATSPSLTTPNIGVASATSLTASSSITGYNLQAFDNVLVGHDVGSLKFGVNNSDYNCALLNFTFNGDGSKTNFASIKLKGSYSQLDIDDDSIAIIAKTVVFLPPTITTSSRILVASTGISFESGGSLNFNNVTTLSPSTILGLDGSKNLVSFTTTGTGSIVLATSPTISNLFSTSQASFLNGGIDSDITTNQILFGFSGSETYRHAIRTRHSGGTDLNNAIDFYCWDTSISSTTSPTRRVMSIDSTGVFVRTGSVNIDTLTASSALATDASKNLVSISNTGTGSNVLATSPVLTTPNIGAATATSLIASATIECPILEVYNQIATPFSSTMISFGSNVLFSYDYVYFDFDFTSTGSTSNYAQIGLFGSPSSIEIRDDETVIVSSNAFIDVAGSIVSISGNNLNFSTPTLAMNMNSTDIKSYKPIVGHQASSAIGVDFALNDNYCNFRVIRNATSTIDKDMYIGYQSGATSSLLLYSNNTEVARVDGGDKIKMQPTNSFIYSQSTKALAFNPSFGLVQNTNLSYFTATQSITGGSSTILTNWGLTRSSGDQLEYPSPGVWRNNLSRTITITISYTARRSTGGGATSFWIQASFNTNQFALTDVGATSSASGTCTLILNNTETFSLYTGHSGGGAQNYVANDMYIQYTFL